MVLDRDCGTHWRLGAVSRQVPQRERQRQRQKDRETEREPGERNPSFMCAELPFGQELDAAIGEDYSKGSVR